MYRIEISDSEKYIDTFRYQQKIKRYDIISIYRPTLISIPKHQSGRLKKHRCDEVHHRCQNIDVE